MDTYLWQHISQIALKDCSRHTEGDVRPDVEESSAELLDCQWINVGSHSQGSKSWNPGLEVRLHGFKELVEILLFKTSEIVLVIQIPVETEKCNQVRPPLPSIRNICQPRVSTSISTVSTFRKHLQQPTVEPYAQELNLVTLSSGVKHKPCWTIQDAASQKKTYNPVYHVRNMACELLHCKQQLLPKLQRIAGFRAIPNIHTISQVRGGEDTNNVRQNHSQQAWKLSLKCMECRRLWDKQDWCSPKFLLVQVYKLSTGGEVRL